MSEPLEPEVGPFRTAEPTEEARLARARAAALERVARVTRAEIEAEQRREVSRDRLAWGALALSSVLCAAVVLVSLVPAARGAPALVCPAVALVLASGLAVLHRRRLGVWRAQRTR